MLFLILLLYLSISAASAQNAARALSFPISQHTTLYKKNTLESPLCDNVAYYSMQLGLGSPLQLYKLAIDTGSSHTWLSATSSLTNSPYDYVHDRTVLLSGDAGSVSYANGGVQYLWATTAVSVGNTSSSSPIHLPIGIAYHAKQFGKLLDGVSGILGLGYPEPGKPSLGDLLKAHGHISRNLFSVSLQSSQNSDGALLFGGIDRSKYVGKLATLAIADTKHSKHIAVTLNTIRLDNTLIHINKQAPLDTGSTLTYLPLPAYHLLLSHLGADDSRAHLYGGPVFNLTAHGHSRISFGFGTTEITLAARELINPAPNPAYRLFPATPDAEMAVLGVLPSTHVRNITILGASFLKSVYVVYDLEEGQVGMAKLSDGTQEARIVPIGEGMELE